MSNAEDPKKAQRVLAEINHMLKTEPLTEAQRAELQHHAAAVAGSLTRPWLPYGVGRRLIMLAIIALGIQQAIVGNYQPLLWWLLLPTFSPRLMDLTSYTVGRIAGVFSRL